MPPALISAMLPSEGPGVVPRAYRQLLGQPLLLRQIERLAECGVTRILIAAEGHSGALDHVIDRTRQAGLQLVMVHTPGELVEAMGDAQELFLMADGLLPDGEALAELLKLEGAFVAVIDDEGQADRYERIDLNDLWAGIARVPARVVQQCASLPEDWNVESALLRQSIQAGIPRHRVAKARLSAGQLLIVHRGQDIDTAEQAIIASAGSSEPGAQFPLVPEGLMGDVCRRLLALPDVRRWLPLLPLLLLALTFSLAILPVSALVCLAGLATVLAERLVWRLDRLDPMVSGAKWRMGAIFAGVAIAILFHCIENGRDLIVILGVAALSLMMALRLLDPSVFGGKFWVPDPTLGLILLSVGALAGGFAEIVGILIFLLLGLANFAAWEKSKRRGAG